MTIIWPDGTTTKPRVTSRFGPRRHPVTGKQQSLHRGVDLAGWSTIVSPAEGVVTINGNQPSGAGYWLEVREPATGHRFRFFHLRTRSPLNVGAKVRPGTALGQMGATGTATAVHLHLEVWVNGSPVDPETYYAQRLHPAATPAPPTERFDPMLYISGKNYVVLGHNGGWVSIAYTPNDPRSEYANLVKKLGEPVWVNAATLNALIEDSRGNANSKLLDEVRELVAAEKAQ